MDERNVVHVMHDMEELRLRLDYGVKALSAVVEGMRHGDYGVSDYADSVYGVYDHLSSINDRMAGVLEAYFDNPPRKPSDDGD